MILNLGSLAFNANIENGGGTPAWGTELGQGEGYRFQFEDAENFLTSMLYMSVSDKENIYCPLGKGGGRKDDYEFVVGSIYDKIFVNGLKVPNEKFILLVVKQINGDYHIGRRTLKYNPRMTYHGYAYNEECYKRIPSVLGINDDAAWFIDEIYTENQDELHFVAYVLDAQRTKYYHSSEERKKDFQSKIATRKTTNHISKSCFSSPYRPYITAVKSKPFLLLAGISGTGKSRIVRELARACWDKGTPEYEAHKPQNYEMVQVKPNWHDSSELIGYVSRISGTPTFIAGTFLRFIVQAWEHPDMPYFLCLDEMNLAPVEQYFAEYLSVIESRKRDEQTGRIVTDPILQKSTEDWYRILTAELTTDEILRNQFLQDGIAIPQNLIVVGTVNMDETTFSFSRKVLDRAMTIEMNEVNLYGGLDSHHEPIGKLTNAELVGTAVEGVDIYPDYKDVCDIVIKYLVNVNQLLDGTPFKIAYRTRNEFLLYVVNNLPYHTDSEGNELPQNAVIARALDEITSMKILSRIEGDETKVSMAFLDNLSGTIQTALQAVYAEAVSHISLPKLAQMKQRLESGYTSFWC